MPVPQSGGAGMVGLAAEVELPAAVRPNGRCNGDRSIDEIQRPAISTSGWGTPETISKSDVKKDISLFNEALNIGLGVEWNLAGTTSLVIGANYMLGFTNVVKKESDYLRKYTYGSSGSGLPEPVNGTALKQSLKTNSIALTVGILF